MKRVLVFLALVLGSGNLAGWGQGIRIAAGGPGGPDTQVPANVWSADQGFSGGATWTNCGTSTTPACPTSIGVPFQNLRYGSFSYSFQLPPGIYQVQLAFIEPNQTTAGARTFNVTANGQAALTGFDVFQAAGGMLVPITKSFPVVATSGQITLQFQTLVRSAVVSGISIQAYSTPGPPGPMLPIQIDSYQIFCSKQPPQNCTGQFALNWLPIGRIFVFKNGVLMPPSCYNVLAPSPPTNANVQFTCTTVDGDVIMLAYPASGPASQIGNPAMLLRYGCNVSGINPNGIPYNCAGLEAHVLYDNQGMHVFTAIPASAQIMSDYPAWPLLATVYFQ